MNPVVSVIIPCRNEGHRIIDVLSDLRDQDLVAPFEVIVADGHSDDDTWQLLNGFLLQEKPYDLVLSRNPGRYTPHGLNVAVNQARGRFIIRIDGHSRLEAHYLSTIYTALSQPGMDVVGPSISYQPADSSLTARVIAWMTNSPFGNGGTPSRSSGQTAKEVKHAVMSCYQKKVWQQVGGYDESFLSNEDFEFDYRAHKAGFKLFALPNPVYFPIARPNLTALAKQRWRYGFWKAQVLKKHPDSLHMRQLLPPLVLLLALPLLFVPPLLSFGVILYAGLAAWVVWQGRFALELSGFTQTILAMGVGILAAAIIHFIWSLGLLWGLAQRPNREYKEANS
jgi:succinoglycan biosynthesis protein ExoA